MGTPRSSKQLVAYAHCRSHVQSHADKYLHIAFLQLTLKTCVQRRSVYHRVHTHISDLKFTEIMI